MIRFPRLDRSRLFAAVRRYLREKPRQLVALVLLLAVAGVSLGMALTRPPQEEEAPSLPADPVVQEEDILHAPGTLEAKLAALKTLALAGEDVNETLQKGMGYRNEAAPFVVFFSVSDSVNRASVVSGVGDTVEAAWQAAEAALQSQAQAHNGVVRWLKADVVEYMERINTEDLPARLEKTKDNRFRQGIAFDEGFEQALLAAELSAGGVLDYETNEISLLNANIYLANADRKGMSMLEETLILFDTAGYFCDENDTAYPLSDRSPYFGQRTVEEVDKDTAAGVAKSAARYLAANVTEDGRFLYCYLPADNRRRTDYNMMRHSGAIWSLCQQAANDSALRLPIDQALTYLQSQIKTQEDLAFVDQENAGELRVGANAMAVLALVEYANVFETDQYDDLIARLANGLLFMQNTADGGFTHVWNTGDVTPKTESYSAYYDGQATGALAAAYARTGDEGYLTAAKAAADWMIAHNYQERGDQWVAYAMNELTRHAPEERYVALALDNAGQNLSAIRDRVYSSPYGLELLMATFEMVDRVTEEGLFPALLQEFDTAALAQAIRYRAQATLNGYFYPETAMYMEYPQQVLGTFFMREDRFRVRLDDVQQGICGYTAYARLYDRLPVEARAADEG